MAYQACHDNAVQVWRVKIVAHRRQAAHIIRLQSRGSMSLQFANTNKMAGHAQTHAPQKEGAWLQLVGYISHIEACCYESLHSAEEGLRCKWFPLQACFD